MPSWTMKLQPFERSSRSRERGYPSSAEGVRCSSSSVKSQRWSQSAGGSEVAMLGVEERAGMRVSLVVRELCTEAWSALRLWELVT